MRRAEHLYAYRYNFFLLQTKLLPSHSEESEQDGEGDLFHSKYSFLPLMKDLRVSHSVGIHSTPLVLRMRKW